MPSRDEGGSNEPTRLVRRSAHSRNGSSVERSGASSAPGAVTTRRAPQRKGSRPRSSATGALPRDVNRSKDIVSMPQNTSRVSSRELKKIRKAGLSKPAHSRRGEGTANANRRLSQSSHGAFAATTTSQTISKGLRGNSRHRHNSLGPTDSQEATLTQGNVVHKEAKDVGGEFPSQDEQAQDDAASAESRSSASSFWNGDHNNGNAGPMVSHWCRGTMPKRLSWKPLWSLEEEEETTWYSWQRPCSRRRR